jgi:hypothetical protein
MPLILGLALAACGTPTGLNPEIRLSFEGSVTSVVDGAPIQGATVSFVNCALGCRTLGTTFTDAAGRYALIVRHRCRPSSAMLFGTLEAVTPSRRHGDSSAVMNPVCTTDMQTINFRLRE